MLIAVEPFGNGAVGEVSGEIPPEGQADGDRLDGMRHRNLPISSVGAAVVRAVASAVGVGAGGATAITVAQGDGAIVEPLAGPLDFALAGLLAQVVNVDLGQHSQHGQGEFAPGGGEVEVLAD